MTYDQIKAHLGAKTIRDFIKGVNALGIAIKSNQTVHNWKRKVPELVQFKLEDKTNGQLKADRT